MSYSLMIRGGEQRLSISNGQIARKMQLSDIGNWNHLRIGLRVNIHDIREWYYNPPPIFIGLCSGTTNKYFSATTNHAIGFITNEYFGRFENYINNSNNRMYIMSANVRGVKKENSVKTTFGNTNNYPLLTIFGTHTLNGTELAYSGAVIIDFVKVNSDIRCDFYYNVDQITTESTFNLIMNNPVIPTVYMEFKGESLITNVNEATYGYFDTVNVGWQSADYSLEVNSLAYAVYS